MKLFLLKTLLVVALGIIAIAPAAAQFGQITYGAPSGSCSAPPQFSIDITNNVVYSCGNAGTWVYVGNAPTVVTKVLAEGTCGGAVAGSDVLCADSVLHAFKSSLNNGSFVAIPQLAGDLGNTAASPQVTSAHISGGTVNTVARFNATGNLVPSALTDAGTVLSSTEAYTEIEAAAPSGIASSDVLYADSAAHRWKMINNNGTAAQLVASGADINISDQVTITHITGATVNLVQKSSASGNMVNSSITDDGTTVSSSEIALFGNQVFVTTDFTDANSASLQAITGLSIPLAASTAYSFHCALMYSQGTPAAGDQFGIGVITTAPANASAFSTTNTNATTVQYGVLTALASTTPTAVVTFTPAVATVLGAVIEGTIETGAGASTFNTYVLNGTAANVIVVKRGSYCTVH